VVVEVVLDDEQSVGGHARRIVACPTGRSATLNRESGLESQACH
jgi:hypothetical protein